MRIKISSIISALFLLSATALYLNSGESSRGFYQFTSRLSAAKPAESATVGPAPSPLTMVLDPGHGGADKGVIGPSGLAESEVTLTLAKKLGSLLEERFGARVVLTRSDDYSVTIDERASSANYYAADIFLSLHLAHSPNSSAKGANILVHGYADSGGAPSSGRTEAGRVEAVVGPEAVGSKDGAIPWDQAQGSFLRPSFSLAEAFRENIRRSALDPEAAVREVPLSLLKGLAMPAVMVEIAFISNPEQEAKLRKNDYLDELSEILYISISDFLKKSQTGKAKTGLSPAGENN